MRLYLKISQHKPQAEELVTFTCGQMDKEEWKDPTSFIYEYLFKTAEYTLAEDDDEETE